MQPNQTKLNKQTQALLKELYVEPKNWRMTWNLHCSFLIRKITGVQYSMTLRVHIFWRRVVFSYVSGLKGAGCVL